MKCYAYRVMARKTISHIVLLPLPMCTHVEAYNTLKHIMYDLILISIKSLAFALFDIIENLVDVVLLEPNTYTKCIVRTLTKPTISPFLVMANTHRIITI